MNLLSLQQTLIKRFQRGPRLRTASLGAFQCHLVAARNRIHTEPLFNQRQILVELAEEIANQPVVFKCKDDVGRVRGRTGRCLIRLLAG